MSGMIREIDTTYDAGDGSKLNIHLFIPAGEVSPAPAIIFFHGGRFVQGHPAQFFPHCRYLATRGIVAASATYRLLNKGANSVLDSLADGRAAIRWMRSQADWLGIDPGNVVAAGGSAGANIAANAAMDTAVGQTQSGRLSSDPPAALILFSPAIVRPVAGQDAIDDRLYQQLIPAPHQPPMLLLHGEADEAFSAAAVKNFQKLMLAEGNRCDLKLYPDGIHGFFNYRPTSMRYFVGTLRQADQFLTEIGMLHGPATLTVEMAQTFGKPDDWDR